GSPHGRQPLRGARCAATGATVSAQGHQALPRRPPGGAGYSLAAEQRTHAAHHALFGATAPSMGSSAVSEGVKTLERDLFQYSCLRVRDPLWPRVTRMWG